MERQYLFSRVSLTLLTQSEMNHWKAVSALAQFNALVLFLRFNFFVLWFPVIKLHPHGLLATSQNLGGYHCFEVCCFSSLQKESPVGLATQSAHPGILLCLLQFLDIYMSFFKLCYNNCLWIQKKTFCPSLCNFFVIFVLILKCTVDRNIVIVCIFLFGGFFFTSLLFA